MIFKSQAESTSIYSVDSVPESGENEKLATALLLKDNFVDGDYVDSVCVLLNCRPIAIVLVVIA